MFFHKLLLRNYDISNKISYFSLINLKFSLRKLVSLKYHYLNIMVSSTSREFFNIRYRLFLFTLYFRFEKKAVSE